MTIERETAEEIAVSVGAVVLFILAIVFIGATYATASDGLSSQGGLYVVVAIAGFVLVMGGLGYILSRR